MEGMFEEGVDQFVIYEKNLQGKKTKHQKKQQRLQKIRAYLKDPEKRRQRAQLRRQQEKMKMKKEVEGMNREQARQFIKQKKEKKKMLKEKTLKGLETGMPILIDMVYEQKMNEKQNKSLATQIQLIMRAIKLMEDPPAIHLCSVGGFGLQQLQKMRYQYWTLKSHTDDILDVAKSLNKKPIYLSPDAPDQLTQIDPDATYIIGGLVDRTVLKNASYQRATDMGIPAVSLPIRQMMKNRACLNLDHVVMMLNKFKQTNDWKTAFQYGAPKRWRRQGQEKQQKMMAKQEQNPNFENESEDMEIRQQAQKIQK